MMGNVQITRIVAATITSAVPMVSNIEAPELVNYENGLIPLISNNPEFDKDVKEFISTDKNNNQVVFLLHSERDQRKKEIIDLIKEILNRDVTVSLEIEEESNVAYFIIKTSDEFFASDYDKIDTLDERTRNMVYRNKDVVITLDDSDV